MGGGSGSYRQQVLCVHLPKCSVARTAEFAANYKQGRLQVSCKAPPLSLAQAISASPFFLAQSVAASVLARFVSAQA